MKSVQINGYGSSEVVEINKEMPEPTVTAGKVLVDVGSWSKSGRLENSRRTLPANDTTSISINHGNRYLWYHQGAWRRCV